MMWCFEWESIFAFLSGFFCLGYLVGRWMTHELIKARKRNKTN